MGNKSVGGRRKKKGNGPRGKEGAYVDMREKEEWAARPLFQGDVRRRWGSKVIWAH